MILGVPAHSTEKPVNVQPTERHPIFGILSIASPLLGIPIAYLIGMAVAVPTDGSGEPDNIGAICAFMSFSGLVILLGFVSAIVAFARRERLQILPVLGLVANIAPIAWFHFVF